MVHATLTILFGVGVFYVLGAGITSVSALRTQPLYGYGTRFLVQRQREQEGRRVLAEALARQEIMNIVRHLRNETAYQALRNGLLILLAGILISPRHWYFGLRYVREAFLTVQLLPFMAAGQLPVVLFARKPTIARRCGTQPVTAA